MKVKVKRLLRLILRSQALTFEEKSQLLICLVEQKAVESELDSLIDLLVNSERIVNVAKIKSVLAKLDKRHK